MGMFSWFTSDEQEQITVDITRDIYMTGKDGRVFHQKDTYEGYGEFGGKDFYEYLAELNGLPSDRQEGIDFTARHGGNSMILGDLEKKGFNSPRLFANERSIRNWDRFDAPENDPNQGWLQEDPDDDYDDPFASEYDDDYPEDDYYESVIEVKEDVKVGDLILEAGDKIKLLKEAGKEFKYTLKILPDQAKQIARNKNTMWHELKGYRNLYGLYDNRSNEHIMTYNTDLGEIWSDFSPEEIEKMIRK